MPPRADASADANPAATPTLADLYAEARTETSEIDGLARFNAIIAKLGGHADDFKVGIAGRRDGATIAHIETVPFTDFDEDELARRHGPGAYRCTLKDARNQIVSNCEVRIAGAPGARPDRSPGVAAPPPQGDRLDRVERMLDKLAERLTDRPGRADSLGEVAQLIAAIKPQSEGIGVKDLITLVTTMLPLIVGKASPLRDTIDAMRMIREMESGGDLGEGGGSIMDIVRQVAAAVRVMPPAAPPSTTPPPPTSPIAPPPTPTPPAERNATATEAAAAPAAEHPIAKAIGFGAFAGVTPENLAPAVIDLIDKHAMPGSVPMERDQLERWLLAQFPGDTAPQVLAMLRPYVAELAFNIFSELDEHDNPPGEDAPSVDLDPHELDDDGNPRAGNPDTAPLTMKGNA